MPYGRREVHFSAADLLLDAGYRTLHRLFFAEGTVTSYGQYTKWGALALFVIITIMAQKWGIGGALASFLALALFATLYAMDETAGIRAAELQKQKEEEEKKKAAEEEQKKEQQKKGGGALSDRSGSVELKASMIFDRAADEKKLFQAAHDGDLAEVTRLVESGTMLDAENANGISPLMFAVKFGHAKVAAYLIEQGADVNKKSKTGVTAMKIAREAKNQELMDLLSAGGALD